MIVVYPLRVNFLLDEEKCCYRDDKFLERKAFRGKGTSMDGWGT